MSSALRTASCLILAGLSALATGQAKAAETEGAGTRISITGSLASPESLPSSSVAVVELREVTRAGAPAELRAIAAARRSVAGQMPVPFRLEVDRSSLSNDRSYLVRAAILSSGRPTWLAAQSLQLPGKTVDLGTLLLSPARQPPPRMLSCGDRVATIRAGEVAELSVGSKRWLLSPVSPGSARYAAADAPLTTLWITDGQATLVVKGQDWAECTVEPFRASGHAPVWSLEIGSKNLRFRSAQGRLQAETPPLSSSGAGARYVTRATGEPITVAVFERPCKHSSSGLPHPHAVAVSAFGKTYEGCGGEPLALLQGTEWVVEQVAGASAARTHVTLNFGADGRAYGQGPCNPYDAGYSLTRGELELSLDAAALKSCERGVMNQERTYFELLKRTQRFEIAADGALVLYTGSGRTIRARASEVP